ncbi:Crp/Fnr family transcriptional regulator [Chloroflexia bacterium SDU3-3]|nr:Crp/Fnr family transcriptional regulator [Chloroflexia bacterium SDU3-3]
MADLLIVGRELPDYETLQAIHREGYRLRIEPSVLASVCGGDAVVLLALDEAAALPRMGHALAGRGIPWIGWNTADDPALMLAAYAAGARMVLPAALRGEVLIQCVQMACGQPAPAHMPHRHGQRRSYRRGEPIDLGDDEVAEVLDGVVAQCMLHSDGSEVLMGLAGPGQLLVGHPDDACCLQLYAHTNTMVFSRRWEDAASTPDFPELLRERIRSLEGWGAMQARQHLDQRILGVLSVLAEQFGRAHPQGTLVDVRVTHAQLASAVGATRSTVTRLLSDMRQRGELASAGAGDGERHILRRWEHMGHTHRHRRALDAAAD